jgi:hypothetical protein
MTDSLCVRGVFLTLAAAVASLAALLAGCSTPSIHPLHSPDALVQDARVEGTWVDGERTRYAVSPRDGGYLVQIDHRTDEGEERRLLLHAHLVRIEGDLFCDLALAEEEFEAIGEQYVLFLIPAHHFARVRPGADELAIEFLHPRRMNALLAGDEAGVAHASVDGETVLTAGSAEMRALLARHAERDIFVDALRLTRPGAPPAPDE